MRVEEEEEECGRRECSFKCLKLHQTLEAFIKSCCSFHVVVKTVADVEFKG